MRHMNDKDRYFIEKSLKAKMPVCKIAETLGFSRQAIYKEIKKGQCEQITTQLEKRVVYLSDVSQRKHDEVMQKCGRKPKLESDDSYLENVKDWIKNKKYSPWAARVKIGDNKVCTKTIYNYIHKGYIPGLTLYDLPYARPDKEKKDKPVKREYHVRGKSIEERNPDILKRVSYGDWEMDTVYSARGDKACLLVLSERMSREEIVIKINDRTSASTIKGLNRLERKLGAPGFRDKFHTITCDNGREFSNFEAIENSSRNKKKRTDLYFCHPYCSSERATNENINRMIRRWIPKGDDIGLYSDEDIKEIQDWINDYPRKIFNGLSSNEFRQLHGFY